jgi:hypothetical protein
MGYQTPAHATAHRAGSRTVGPMSIPLYLHSHSAGLRRVLRDCRDSTTAQIGRSDARADTRHFRSTASRYENRKLTASELISVPPYADPEGDGDS